MVPRLVATRRLGRDCRSMSTNIVTFDAYGVPRTAIQGSVSATTASPSPMPDSTSPPSQLVVTPAGLVARCGSIVGWDTDIPKKYTPSPSGAGAESKVTPRVATLGKPRPERSRSRFGSGGIGRRPRSATGRGQLSADDGRRHGDSWLPGRLRSHCSIGRACAAVCHPVEWIGVVTGRAASRRCTLSLDVRIARPQISPPKVWTRLPARINVSPCK